MGHGPFFKDQFCNYPDKVTIHGKLTCAADVQENGITVSEGSKFIASAARSDEGEIVITLTQPFKRFLGLRVFNSRVGSFCRFSAEEIIAATGGTITVIFYEGAVEDGSLVYANTDPDSATIYIEIDVSNNMAAGSL